MSLPCLRGQPSSPRCTRFCISPAIPSVHGFASFECVTRLTSLPSLGVEMETAALYTLAARFSVKALSICTVSDDLLRHEFMSSDDRQSSLKDMIALALDVATQ